MPASRRLAMSQGNLPPTDTPSRIAHRLGFAMNSEFLSTKPGLHLLVEDAQKEAHEPRVKMPQVPVQFFFLTFPGSSWLSQAGIEHMTQVVTALMSQPPYNLKEHQYVVTIHSRIMKLDDEDLPVDVRLSLKIDEMFYVWASITLLEPTPHLETDNFIWIKPEALPTLCQSYRKKLYNKVLGIFRLFRDNITSLPHR